MTTKELNRDAKRLLALSKTLTDDLFQNNPVKYDSIVDAVKAEISRLYYADSKFEYANKQTILILMRLNLRYRAVVLHVFGINIEL
jgi:hypothetical protein